MEEDQLRLIFTCCHPRLSPDDRIALALREVCDLETEQIAQAYLVSPEAMKRRISRAKRSIREKGIPYILPSKTDLAGRLDAILHVIYLIYNQGSSFGSEQNQAQTMLIQEALFLSRELRRLLPCAESMGLLALLLLHESREPARWNARGDLVPLEQQDRSQWDQGAVREAMELIRKALLSGEIGQYTLQAAIASVHAEAGSVETTDWSRIIGYYDMLLTLVPSPVIELQRAVAVGMKDGPEAGRVLTEGLIREKKLARYHRVFAVHADFCAKAGYREEAVAALSTALTLAEEGPERRFLEEQWKKITEK